MSSSRNQAVDCDLCGRGFARNAYLLTHKRFNTRCISPPALVNNSPAPVPASRSLTSILASMSPTLVPSISSSRRSSTLVDSDYSDLPFPPAYGFFRQRPPLNASAPNYELDLTPENILPPSPGFMEALIGDPLRLVRQGDRFGRSPSPLSSSGGGSSHSPVSLHEPYSDNDSDFSEEFSIVTEHDLCQLQIPDDLFFHDEEKMAEIRNLLTKQLLLWKDFKILSMFDTRSYSHSLDLLLSLFLRLPSVFLCTLW